MLQPSLLAALLLLLLHLQNASCKAPTKELPRPLIPLHELEEEEPLPFQGTRNGRSRRPTLMDVALQQSVRQGLDAMAELYGRIQPEMLRNGQTLQDNHPAAMLARFNAPTTDSERREMAAYATIAAAKAFRKNFQHIDELARQSHSQRISLRRTALEGLCPPRDPPPCMPASERYRTHDGTCNNKRRPRWGAAQMPFNRFLPPEYGDGVDTVRSSTDGSTLSSSRFVSLLVHGAREGEAPLTLMIAQWGQMLDHDMTSTAQPRSINGSIPSCCGGKDFHPACFPIKVPLDDPWLAPLKVRCLEFLRSAPAQRRDCVLSWREQTNQVTSYIDASPIYSNSAKSSDNARVFRHGLLVYGRGDPAEDVCQRGAIATKCIRSGDGRSGEQPGLLAMHHVWVGEHNRIAMELSELNPHWSDEKVYQETRRIVGAMFQHITFREFLPVILGREVAKLFDLELMPSGYYERYSSKVNPTVANAFAAAAFRFGHSLVQNSYTRCDRHHNVINNNVSLHEEFQRGDIGSAGSLHRLLRGLASQRALKRDEFITPELTNHLFQTPGFPFGLDLAAINIQRGRDHGIAPYTAWRVPCGLSPILSWDDFANVVGPESAKRIGHAYRSVHDIDLFVGGIAERPVVGGLVGPTFACIIAQQFSNARRGDRFWYENGGFESSFTPAQLHSLRRVSLAQVLCRTVGGGTLQPHIFIPAEFEDNERQTCGVGSLSPIDLSPWLEQDPFHNQQVPDQVFNIGQPELGSVQIIKEDKAGFSNRVKPNKPQVELITNSGSGFLRPTNGNSTKVSDKLDLRRKTATNSNKNSNNRQTSQTRKPVSGVNNKLDKSPKITINIKSVNVRRPEGSGPKRRVVINNVPVELRSSGGNASDTETGTGTLTEDENEFEDEEVDFEDVEEVRANNDPLKLTNPELKETETEAKAKTLEDDKKNLDTKPPTDTPKTDRRDIRKLEATKISKTLTKPADSRLLHFQLNRTSTPRDFQTSSTVSLDHFTQQTKAPKISKPTKRAVELRQYQNRPLYERPQKVVVNGPNADQYEIEINIRQTNKNPGSRPSTADYGEYTTAQKPYYNSNYAPHYVDYGSTTPIPLPSYGYQPLAEISQGQRTKPPTIIYLNDNDDRRTTTTRAPNIFQNFLTFATNSFNPLGNRRPMPTTPSPSPISQSHKEPSQFESNLVHSPISNSHILTGGSLSYSPRPQSVHSYPVAVTSSQIGANPGSGFLHASSSALSSGHFGSISGVATANGADSTFSFNIRPRPNPELSPVVSSYPRPSANQGIVSGGGGSYGLVTQSSYRPDFAPPQSELYYDRELTSDRNPSPFSGSSSGSRPASTFYGRTPELKEAGNNSNELSQTEHKLYLQDYDYVSRTLSNLTNDESQPSEEDADYVYDEDMPTNELDKTETRKDTDATESTKKFDKDGYMRPQMMRDSNRNSTLANVTALDDNYVMPMLEKKTRTGYVTEVPKPMLSTSSRSVTNSKVTVFPDSLGKQLGNDILADETDDYVDGNSEARLKAQKLKQLASVAFAPITVLTKPDRPDNWVIYQKVSEEPPLPQPPVINSDVAPTGEVPTPIKNFNNAWRKQDLNAQPETKLKPETKLEPETKIEPETKSENVPTKLEAMKEAQEETTVAAADSI
ncbi:uncharacterized protein LOC108099526 [Drosophila ficusphila]|uniref:uncharacterized protein LOC108099526 n=1 Tax=Drosophila ficusphila TaxID=30025 RepID=UPI0007E804B2|nr:uncharacterized protein LOC108099526 [Drosophila ficusphila]